jgi:hypothetical protein
MDTGGYFVNGYWWFLMVIILVAIGGYCWLFIIIILTDIGGYILLVNIFGY